MDIKTLNELLKSYNIKCECNNTTDNTFFTEYILIPSIGFNLKKLQNNIDNMQMFFDNKITLNIINNKPVIQEEKPNRAPVDFFKTWKPQNGYNLPVLVGLDSQGMPFYTDLTKMPHLLVAGSTGSGKSVFLHNLIMSLIFTHKTTLVLIDLKRVELSLYNGLYEIENNETTVTTAEGARNILKSVCNIMDNRYKAMERARCRSFEEYQKLNPNEKYMTVVIDELADLMLNKQYRKEVELYIVRIAQLARAVGIHLVVATQRPSTDVVTGLIKANIPSRISFSLASAVDSRVIINKSGAEKLNGHGDGLFLPIGADVPKRFQACMVETNKIINYVEHAKPQKLNLNKKSVFNIFKR